MTSVRGSVDIELEVVGKRIGELRKSAGLRLTDLADATGYTTGYISRIERGSSLPSLTAMATLAIALGVEMATFIESVPEPEITVTPMSEGHELHLRDGNRYRVLGPLGADRPFTAMIQNVSTDGQVHRHFGERFILVLDGSIEIVFNDDVHQIETMGTIHYGAHEEHSGTALSEQDAQILIVSSPAIL